MSVAVFEVAAGHAAPTGSSIVWHNGKQYAVTDGAWAGSTFIPNSNSMPYPTAPTLDLSPIYNRITLLEELLVRTREALDEHAAKIEDALGNTAKIAAALEEWSMKLSEMLETRFDEIDQALRLVLDE